MKVLFLTQTSQIGASARYRVYQYLPYLKEQGVDATLIPAVSDRLLMAHGRSDSLLIKGEFYLSQVARRLLCLRQYRKYDVIFIQRDLVIHIYPFLEKLISLFNRNIIFDFDDPIYLYPPNKKAGFLFRLLCDKRKAGRIIKLSKHVIVGNTFLKNYALNFTENITLIPTSIDSRLYKADFKPRRINSNITIGWIGSQGTFHYLKNIFPVFIELAKISNIELKIIGAHGPQFAGLKICYKDWSLNTEVEDIKSFDIGVMPLTVDEWSRGKSATKLLQYMAAGVPAVASPVGVNCEIIQDGINGFLADSLNEWIVKISYLINDSALANKISQEAQKTINANYSIEVNAPKLAKVIKGFYK